MKPKPLKLVVAVDVETGAGEVYRTTGSPHVSFTGPAELLRMVARTLSSDRNGSKARDALAEPCSGDCRWTLLRFVEDCEHAALACASCHAVWCPCDTWTPRGDAELEASIGILRAAVANHAPGESLSSRA